MRERVQVEHVGDNRRTVGIDEIPRDVRFGLYIVQSESMPQLFRVGAGGVGTGKATLYDRLKTHLTGKPDNSDPKNLTKVYRTWRIIWSAAIRDCDRLPVLLGECALTARLAAEYSFVHNSIFHDADKDVGRVVGIAQQTMPAVLRVIDFQMQARKALPEPFRSVDASAPDDDADPGAATLIERSG